MTKFHVKSNAVDFGEIEANNEQGARDLAAQDAGYHSETDMVERLGEPSEFVVSEVKPIRLFDVEFEGGSVDDLGPVSTIWLDLDRGGAKWAALLPQGELGQAIKDIEDNTGAQLVSVRLWDGEAFGDGNGTIRSPKPGTLVASNLYGGGPDLPAGWTLENA